MGFKNGFWGVTVLTLVIISTLGTLFFLSGPLPQGRESVASSPAHELGVKQKAETIGELRRFCIGAILQLTPLRNPLDVGTASYSGYLENYTITDASGAGGGSAPTLAMAHQNNNRTIHVPQDYPTIQEAIANAQPGDLIEVDATQGPYEGLILVNKSVKLRSAQGRAVIGASNSQEDVITITSSSVQISGFVIRYGNAGIGLVGVNSSVVEDNVLIGNRYGIILVRSARNILLSNQVNDNEWGIMIRNGSDDNIVQENVLKSNSSGLFLASSTGNLVEKNTFSANYAGILLGDRAIRNIFRENNIEQTTFIGIYVENGSENTLEANTVHGSGEAGIRLRNASDRNTLRENSIHGSPVGISFISSNSNVLMANTTESNYYGIRLEESHDNTLIGNTAKNNSENGIYLKNKSNGNLLEENKVLDNGNGIVLRASMENRVQFNEIRSNGTGLLLDDAQHNTIANNTMGANRNYGILITGSSNNTLVSNVIERNGDTGVRLEGGAQNVLQENTVRRSPSGIGLESSNRNRLEANVLERNEYGIVIDASFENEIMGNIASENAVGISLVGRSHNNELAYNVARENGDGFALNSSNTNRLVCNISINNETGIRLSDSSDNTLSRNSIRGSKGTGLALIAASHNRVEGNNVESNAVGIEMLSDSVNILRRNNIARNSDFGVKNQTSNTLSAVENWWGDASGPFHPTDNPSGIGNKVSDRVDFEPWLINPVVVRCGGDGD